MQSYYKGPFVRAKSFQLPMNANGPSLVHSMQAAERTAPPRKRGWGWGWV